MAGKKPVDLETQLKDIRRQLNDQLGCLEFRMESKLSLLSEFQEFFKRRGEVEYEYARSLERLCEKFEKNTKQRNIRNEVRSTFNLWSTLLAETRKMSRERANLAELLASEMVSRLEIMAKDVHMLAKKCKELCIDVQDQFLRELRDLSEQTKVYQHSYHNTSEAYTKLVRSREKADAIKGSSARKKKAQEKESERERQYKGQKHLLMKNRNEYLLAVARCNALSMQYFNMDIMDVIEFMDFDYHKSFQRLVAAYRENECETCEAVQQSADVLVEQSKNLNFENDLHYFLSEYSQPFSPPNAFQFVAFEADEETEYKVNTEDVFKRAQKSVGELAEEKQTLEIQREEDVKTVQHMEQVNLRRYQVTSVDDALAVLEDNGDLSSFDSSGGSRGTASLERGLSYTTKGGQALQLSQKGKKDNLTFTLSVVHRRIVRSGRLALVHAQLDLLEKALDEQKVPPVPVGVNEHGQSIPGEVPRLFGGDVLEYIMATGCDIPLIVKSCVKAIEKEGLNMEGLFRVPGPAAYTEELRKGFEEGRDPLAYIQKLDVAAVASVLKAYFRELSTPLFPTDKYTDFIQCTRQEDLQHRIDAIRDAVNDLHPAVVTVMRFLFKFLYRVSLHSAESRMGSANLALVFGPTLTRAPDSLDPRQLHNDVPAINMLIQLCIDQHQYIFGEEDDEGSPSPPIHITSPLHANLEDALLQEPPLDVPPSTATAPPTMPQVVVSSGEQERKQEPDLQTHPSTQLPISPLHSGSTPPPPLPPRPMSPPVQPPSLSPQATPPLPPRHPRQSSPQPELESSQEEISQDIPTQSHAPPTQVEAPPTQEPTTSTEQQDHLHLTKLEEKQRKESGGSFTQELSTLDEAMKDIQASLEGIGEGEEGGVKEEEQVINEPSDEETDSDEDEDIEVMKINARALYDYTARSDKELSFNRGDILQVIEKTPDHNWWDGIHEDRRGFIPVSYVEITELQPAPLETLPPQKSDLQAPPPPVRRSSVQDREEERGSHVPHEPPIKEEKEPEARKTPESLERKKTPEPSEWRKTPEPSELRKTPEPQEQKKTPEPERVISDGELEPGNSAREKPSEKPEEEKKAAEPEPSPSRKKPSTVSGAVSRLTQQFQQESQQQQRVLVEPHSAHRRQHSDLGSPRRNLPPPEEGISRSSSTSGSPGGKVGAISLQFESRPAPPPVRPKPHIHSPGAEQGASAFPIMSHSSLPSASPLQKAALVSQVGQTPPITVTTPRKPAPPPTAKPPQPPASGKPQPPASGKSQPPASGKTKGSFKGRQRSTKRKEEEEKKPPLPSKPPLPPPGRGSPKERTAALHVELQQAALARRKANEDLK